MVGRQQAGCNLAVHTCSLEIQQYEKIKEGDSAPLLCSSETIPGYCAQLWGLQHKGMMEVQVAKSRGGHKGDWRAGGPLLKEKAERAGVVHPEKEKALGRPHGSF